MTQEGKRSNKINQQPRLSKSELDFIKCDKAVQREIRSYPDYNNESPMIDRQTENDSTNTCCCEHRADDEITVSKSVFSSTRTWMLVIAGLVVIYVIAACFNLVMDPFEITNWIVERTIKLIMYMLSHVGNICTFDAVFAL